MASDDLIHIKPPSLPYEHLNDDEHAPRHSHRALPVDERVHIHTTRRASDDSVRPTRHDNVTYMNDGVPSRRLPLANPAQKASQELRRTREQDQQSRSGRRRAHRCQSLRRVRLLFGASF